MLIRPRFKGHLHVETVDPDLVFLLAETQQTALRGRAYRLLAPRIDGRSTVDEIVTALADEHSAAELFFAMMVLERRGYLAEGGALSAHETAFWDAAGVAPGPAHAALEASRVAVRACGDVPAAPMEAALARLGIATVPAGEELQIVVVSDALHPELEHINTTALRAGRPWLLVKPNGLRAWVGPLFVPGRTGCWACLAQRLRANRQVEMFLLGHLGRTDPFPVARASLPGTIALACDLAATHVARWLAGAPDRLLEGRIVTLEVGTLTTEHHLLTRLPQCAACGDPRPAAARPITLEPSPALFSDDGGQRQVSPQATYEKYRRHLSAITGVVSQLEADTNVGGDIHVYFAGQNTVQRHDEYSLLRRDLRNRSSGKGKSDAQARTSALCEAIERHCAVFRGDEPRRQARYRDLGGAAIHPNACTLYSERQYAARIPWSPASNRYTYVPSPFDENEVIDWTPVWSLSRSEFRWLPTAFCYLWYPMPRARAFCIPDSNGNASGNTREEAILQGMYELVERDCVALWWYNRVSRPSVDLATFDEPWLHRIGPAFERMRRDLWVLDITNDLGIPTFVALSRRLDSPEEQIIMGFGTHADARLGVLRAVTELNQLLPATLCADQEDLRINEPVILDWWTRATVANQPYLSPGGTRRAGDYPEPWSADARDSVLRCQRIVEQKGLELLVLDQTRPDIEMPVVKVICPGLRYFWARFAPGRLYDVPVQLGWLDVPTDERALNPHPIFI